ncbi:MAG TPA: D-glycero-beta-D-manno-heptose 1-phosphate adenylyltransferase [Bdellovibrionota bacterium]|jgi:D-beta-D-heptose 7-phosphate kinase/D-beta-D-heptose 1-phosphate adenosyltransferase
MPSKPRTSSKKVLAPASASRWARAFQKKGKRVVFTNGCFDLLHSGHVTYLEQARRLGDALVVALNGDASVRRLKGKGRPLVTLKDRARVMAALECVDAVTWFHETTPVKLVARLKPKIYVKGGDWDVRKIPEYEVVAGYGGKALALNFVRGRSTTRLIQKARKGR